MNAMMFGRAPHSLFGVYHPPRTMRARRSGVVLCYPFGQEYMRAHRAYRQLALLLSNAGFHVMRFDYSGTGDSAGDATSGSLTQWIADAQSAAEELKEVAEISRVSFVGLRLGAAVAAMAAESRIDVDEVVLWDPLVSGDAHIEELLPFNSREERPMRADGINGVLGFPLTTTMRAEICAFDLRQVAGPPTSGRLVVVSRTHPEYDALCDAPSVITRARLAVVPGAGDWNTVDDFGGALIPVAHIQAIVAHLVKETS